MNPVRWGQEQPVGRSEAWTHSCPTPSCAEKPPASEEPLSKSLFGPPLESAAFDHEDFTGSGGAHSRRGGRRY